MKVILTGADGLLARDLIPTLRSRGFEVVASDVDRLDITDEAAVRELLSAEKPSLVVNCAAYTAVDLAEKEPEEAMRVNGMGPGILARAAAAARALMVHFSTDFVFDGRESTPYKPEDPCRPLNAYGRSKLRGEEEVMRSGAEYLIVRTSWLYGAGGGNFVSTMLARAKEAAPLRVVDDQVGRPTWAESLSTTTVDLLEAEARGVWHVTGGGEPTTWLGFARRILALSEIDVPISGVASEAWGALAQRPQYSVLDLSATESLLGRRTPSWDTDLRRFLARKDS